MNWIIELAEQLPIFLVYVVPGFIFLATYRYILYKDQQASTEAAYTLLKSIVASFVLKSLFDAVFTSCFHRTADANDSVYLFLLFGAACLLGYAVALLARSKITNSILGMIGIRRTIHENIWGDIYKPGCWLRIWYEDDGGSYLGQVKYRENYDREPIIQLECYQRLDQYGKVVSDYSKDPKHTIVLNTAQFKRVEVIYN